MGGNVGLLCFKSCKTKFILHRRNLVTSCQCSLSHLLRNKVIPCMQNGIAVDAKFRSTYIALQ